MLEQKSKILIIRLSSIGDILLTTPFIKQVKTTFPNAHISYLLKKDFSDLIAYNPHINSTIVFDPLKGYKGLKKLINSLDNYDLILDLHNNLRSNRITMVFDETKVFKINKNKVKRTLLVYLKINLFESILTASEKYLRTGQSIGVVDNGEKLELHWTGIIASTIERILDENLLEQGRYLCIALGAAHYTKRWPVENSIQLIKMIMDNSNLKIVLLGGPKESNLIQKFSNHKRVINLAGRLSLLESAGLIKHSKGIITNDSGLMHMAAAVNQSIIAIFGSTTKELGFFPYRANATIIENNKIWCRPCTHIGRGYCPLGHFDCMRSITVDSVFEKVSEKFI